MHELGHNLGMHHPFNRKGLPKYSKESGEICTGKSVGGFMDYIPDQFRRKWSACSVEDFKTYYQLYILRKGCFCLETCEPEPTPKPTTPKPQRPKPSICKRLCKKGRYVNLKFCQRVCGVEWKSRLLREPKGSSTHISIRFAWFSVQFFPRFFLGTSKTTTTTFEESKNIDFYFEIDGEFLFWFMTFFILFFVLKRTDLNFDSFVCTIVATLIDQSHGHCPLDIFYCLNTK